MRAAVVAVWGVGRLAVTRQYRVRRGSVDSARSHWPTRDWAMEESRVMASIVPSSKSFD